MGTRFAPRGASKASCQALLRISDHAQCLANFVVGFRSAAVDLVAFFRCLSLLAPCLGWTYSNQRYSSRAAVPVGCELSRVRSMDLNHLAGRPQPQSRREPECTSSFGRRATPTRGNRVSAGRFAMPGKMAVAWQQKSGLDGNSNPRLTKLFFLGEGRTMAAQSSLSSRNRYSWHAAGRLSCWKCRPAHARGRHRPNPTCKLLRPMRPGSEGPADSLSAEARTFRDADRRAGIDPGILPGRAKRPRHRREPAINCRASLGKIWDLNTAKESVTLKSDRGIRSVALSLRTGRRSRPGRVRRGCPGLRDPETNGQELLTLKGYNIGVNRRGLFAGQHPGSSARRPLDKVVKLSGSMKGQQPPASDFLGHTGMVYTVAFFHKSQAFVTGGQDKTAKIWDLATGGARSSPWRATTTSGRSGGGLPGRQGNRHAACWTRMSSTSGMPKPARQPPRWTGTRAGSSPWPCFPDGKLPGQRRDGPLGPPLGRQDSAKWSRVSISTPKASGQRWLFSNDGKTLASGKRRQDRQALGRGRRQGARHAARRPLRATSPACSQALAYAHDGKSMAPPRTTARCSSATPRGPGTPCSCWRGHTDVVTGLHVLARQSKSGQWQAPTAPSEYGTASPGKENPHLEEPLRRAAWECFCLHQGWHETRQRRRRGQSRLKCGTRRRARNSPPWRDTRLASGPAAAFLAPTGQLASGDAVGQIKVWDLGARDGTQVAQGTQGPR